MNSTLELMRLERNEPELPLPPPPAPDQDPPDIWPLGPNNDPDVEESARASLDELLENARLYTYGPDFKDLLDFMVRLQTFSLFNAMLLHIQKPGLSFAATTTQWWRQFGRRKKEGARPLLILRPFGPVALVFDVQDTEGAPLPQDVFSFPVEGNISARDLEQLKLALHGLTIDILEHDAGDGLAGYIRLVKRADDPKDYSHYRLALNRNHSPPTQYATLAHELAHLFLGHLGKDAKLRIPKRQALSHAQRELEAESTAYLVCKRQNICPRAETYLAHFVTSTTTADELDVYQIVRAAGRVESLLGRSAHNELTPFGPY